MCSFTQAFGRYASFDLGCRTLPRLRQRQTFLPVETGSYRRASLRDEEMERGGGDLRSVVSAGSGDPRRTWRGRETRVERRGRETRAEHGVRPSLRDGNVDFAWVPWVKTHDYRRASLRNEEKQSRGGRAGIARSLARAREREWRFTGSCCARPRHPDRGGRLGNEKKPSPGG